MCLLLDAELTRVVCAPRVTILCSSSRVARLTEPNIIEWWQKVIHLLAVGVCDMTVLSGREPFVAATE